MTVGRTDRVQFGRRYLSGATMWVEVGETVDCTAEAMYQGTGCGCRKE